VLQRRALGMIMARTRGRERAFPYFKVQSRDPVSLVWRDTRKEAFDTEAEARAFQSTMAADVESRVMRWDKTGARPLDA